MRQKDVWGVWHCKCCKSLGLIVETGKCCAVAALVKLDESSDHFKKLPPPLPLALAA